MNFPSLLTNKRTIHCFFKNPRGAAGASGLNAIVRPKLKAEIGAAAKLTGSTVLEMMWKQSPVVAQVRDFSGLIYSL